MELETDNLPEFNDLSMSLKQLEEVNVMEHIEKCQELSAGKKLILVHDINL